MPVRRRVLGALLSLLLALALVSAPVPPAHAASDGDLDPTFSGDGVHVDATDGVIGPSVEVQEDGRVLVAGHGPAGGVVQRYTTAGEPDATFGGDGEAVAGFGGPAEIWGMALQADGRIVIAGSTARSGADDSDLAIARFLPDGSPDPAFRHDGVAALDLGFREGSHAVAVAPDGRIVVAGRTQVAGGFDFLVVRFTATGALDRTFSGDGRATVDFGGPGDEAVDVTLQPDGRIVVAGRTDAGGPRDHDLALARLRPTGALDHGFHGDGRVRTDLGGIDKASTVVVQPDGRLVVVGWTVDGDADFAVLRYTAAGAPDLTFAGDGVQTTDFGGRFDYAKDVAVRPDGRIVVGGSARVSPVGDGDLALARYLSGGALDTTFGGDGTVTTDVSAYDSIGSLALQPDDRVVVSGATGDDVHRVVVARYLG